MWAHSEQSPEEGAINTGGNSWRVRVGWTGSGRHEQNFLSWLYLCMHCLYILYISVYWTHLGNHQNITWKKQKQMHEKYFFRFMFFYFHYYMFHISLYITNIRKMFRISVFILVMMNTNYIFVHCSCFLFGQISNEARVARFLSYDCWWCSMLQHLEISACNTRLVSKQTTYM